MVVNCICNGVGMRFFFENIFGGGLVGGLVSSSIVFCVALSLKIGVSGKAEQLSIREEFLDSFMIFTKLRTVTFIKDENYSFLLNGFKRSL